MKVPVGRPNWCLLLGCVPLVVSLLCWTAASEQSSAAEARPDRTDSSASVKASNAANANTAGRAPAAQGLVVDGERFTIRQIIDRQQGAIPVCAFAAPETWRDKSQVSWNYAFYSNPVSMSGSVENPANEEAVFLFPAVCYYSLTPDYGRYQAGRNSGGLIELKPQTPAPTLLNLVRQARGGFPKFQVIGSKDLPDLPKALHLPPGGNQRGIGVKITYELNSKPVEEEFYAVYASVDIPYDGPQGRTWQKNWGLMSIHSFRAPLGKLDARRNIFSAISKSFRPNPAWRERQAAINAFLADQFNRQLKAGYDAIAAAGRMSRQISANNDAMLAAIDRQLQSSRTSSSAGATAGGGRSGNDKFDDYIRGVDTVDDPYWGTSQHSLNNEYHWTDGYGTYRNSNDPNYDPNQHENGNWQLMPMTR
jgi:hypothetical protein